MKPLFKTVLLQVEKQKDENVDELFNDKKQNIRPTSEVLLLEFADDCENCIFTLRGKRVLWNKMALDVISETDDHQIVLARENSLLLEL